MIYCPVCGNIIHTKKGVVNSHGTNSELCYGSYMAAKDCKYAGPSPAYLSKKTGLSSKKVKEILKNINV